MCCRQPNQVTAPPARFGAAAEPQADGSLYYVMPQLPVEAASLAVTD